MNIIKKYLIKKIAITTMSLFLLLLFILIPTKSNIKPTKTKPINNKIIYLLDNDNYTSRVSYYYDELTIKEEIINRINILKNGLDNFKSVIPKYVKLIDVKIEKNNVYLNFNKKFLNIKNIKKTLECITYSLCEIDGIDNIYISVDNKMMDGMPLNKKIGINEEYNLDSFNDVDKTIIFFSKNDYYVPITKINNGKNEKIETIIKELKSSANSVNNLSGFLTNDVELISYNINKDKIELVFNKILFDDKIKFILSASVFSNYNASELAIYDKDKSKSITIKNKLDF